MLQAFKEAKARHPGMLLLFRIGDFYEAWEEEDAWTVARACNLGIAYRSGVPMAAFPHHSLEAHLRRLLQAGHRVAICEQVPEAPKPKEVMRVVIDDSAEPEEQPCVIDQGSLFAGVYVPSILQQRTLFDVGKPERKPAAEEVRPDQGEMFQ
jgi:DNA mismatch repair protein MutS